MISDVEQRSRLFLSAVTIASIGMIWIGVLGISRECGDYECLHTAGNQKIPLQAQYRQCESEARFTSAGGSSSLGTSLRPKTKKLTRKDATVSPDRAGDDTTTDEVFVAISVHHPVQLEQSVKSSPSEETVKSCLKELEWKRTQCSDRSYIELSIALACLPVGDAKTSECFNKRSRESHDLLGSGRIYSWQAGACLSDKDDTHYTHIIKDIRSFIDSNCVLPR